MGVWPLDASVCAGFDGIPSMTFYDVEEAECYGHTQARSVKTVYPPTI